MVVTTSQPPVSQALGTSVVTGRGHGVDGGRVLTYVYYHLGGDGTRR